MNIWPKISIIGYGGNPRFNALDLATCLRDRLFNLRNSLRVAPIPQIEACTDSNIKKQLHKAIKNNSTHIIIMKNKQISVIKDMINRKENIIPSQWIPDEFCRLMEKEYL